MLRKVLVLILWQVVGEQPNKNYFSPSSFIPKIINAAWELIRSLIIPYTQGPEYKEGFLLLVLRLIGLVIAGVPAHLPQDYVNATRLGSSNVYVSLDDQSHQQTINLERKTIARATFSCIPSTQLAFQGIRNSS